jgi:hypothetical protein
MKVAVFTLRIDAEAGGFDDAELRAFVEAHDVLGVHEHMLHRALIRHPDGVLDS